MKKYQELALITHWGTKIVRYVCRYGLAAGMTILALPRPPRLCDGIAMALRYTRTAMEMASRYAMTILPIHPLGQNNKNKKRNILTYNLDIDHI